MLQTASERRVIWNSARLQSSQPSTHPYIRAVEQALGQGWLGRIWRRAVRLSYFAATWTVAQAIAARARRTTEQALTSPVLPRS